MARTGSTSVFSIVLIALSIIVGEAGFLIFISVESTKKKCEWNRTLFFSCTNPGVCTRYVFFFCLWHKKKMQKRIEQYTRVFFLHSTHNSLFNHVSHDKIGVESNKKQQNQNITIIDLREKTHEHVIPSLNSQIPYVQRCSWIRKRVCHTPRYSHTYF